MLTVFLASPYLFHIGPDLANFENVEFKTHEETLSLLFIVVIVVSSLSSATGAVTAVRARLHAHLPCL
jgi:hypothetical protein